MTKGRTLGIALVAAVTAFLTAFAGIALADTLDADYLATSSNQGNLGVLSPGTSVTDKYFTLTLNCNGQGHAVPGTSLGFAVDVQNQSPTAGAGAGELSTVSASLVVPSSWPTDGTGCAGVADATGTITFAVNVPAGAATGTRRFKIALNPSDGDVANLDNIFVTYCVTACDTTGGGGGEPQNQPPTANAGSDVSGNEGSAIQLDGSDSADADGSIVSNVWTINATGIDAGGSCDIDDASSATPKVTCDDDSGTGSFVATLTVTDNSGATDDDTANVTVNNVAPVASNPSLSVNPWTGVANASFSYADAGDNDTHTASFSWGGTASANNGTASSTKTFAANTCQTISLTGKVTDDDGADSNEVTLADGTQQFPVYSAQILAPFKDGERNIVKAGNVVPVKIRITNPCTGGSVTDSNLFINYYKGVGDAVDSTPVAVAESVSSADGSGGQMRLADGFYIYNFATKPLMTGQDYTIRIWQGALNTGTVVLDAVIQPKK
jgi:hypothetical protein